uniref:Uncharacterized protein n=1 Tax=Glossina austeni TaxID=7395 RepID=A0A1A9UWF8_GLOAU
MKLITVDGDIDTPFAESECLQNIPKFEFKVNFEQVCRLRLDGSGLRSKRGGDTRQCKDGLWQRLPIDDRDAICPSNVGEFSAGVCYSSSQVLIRFCPNAEHLSSVCNKK